MSEKIDRRRFVEGGLATAALAALPSAQAKGQKMSEPMPTLYLPHGGGPCFFMEWTMGPPDTWDKMADWLRSFPGALKSKPKALLVISAHWEEEVPTLNAAKKPELLFDYYGFPKHTYELTWPVPLDARLVERTSALLTAAGIESRTTEARGLDHGVFVPLKLSFPKANVPVVQLSLQRGLNPKKHLEIGRALQPLRNEGVLILGSGMSYHNMRGFNRPESKEAACAFDAWLTETTALSEAVRHARLVDWTAGPSARSCHPREEHLLPLMVCAGAAGRDAGRRVFKDEVMGVTVSAHQFG